MGDVFTWILCFHRFVAAASTFHPGKVSQFLAYSNTILCGYLEFKGDGWRAYYRAFCLQVSGRPSKDWSVLNLLSMQDCLLPSPGGVTHTATAPVGITPVTSAHGASTWLSPRQDPLIQMRGWVNPLFVYLGTLGPAGSLPHATSGTYAHTAWRHIRPRSVH
jgi:hypothetical protein